MIDVTDPNNNPAAAVTAAVATAATQTAPGWRRRIGRAALVRLG